MEDFELSWNIPSHIDLDSLVKKNPPQFVETKKFKIDFFYFIIDHLLNKSLTEDLEKNLGYINLNSIVLQSVMHNYKEYLDYLLQNGVIQTDKKYRKANKKFNVEGKSLGYRLTFKWDNDLKILTIPIHDRVLLKKLRDRKSESYKEHEEAKAEYPNLTRWFEKLDFDSIAAEKWLDENPDYILPMSGIRGTGRGKPKTVAKKAKILWSVKKLEKRDFFFKVDDKGGRFHSNLTNLKKELRRFLTCQGQPLINVDIKSSQPFLSTLLFHDWFYNKNSEKLSLDKFPGIVESMVPSAQMILLSDKGIRPYIMLEENSQSIDNQNIDNSDIVKYFELIKSGMFYEKLSEILFPDQPINRELAKEMILQVFFSGNQFIAQTEYNRTGKSAIHKRRFQESFPMIYKLFTIYKRKNKPLLARLLQQIESTIILKHIVPRIASERPDLPIFTIHDSIATTVGNQEYVKAVMREEINRLTGLDPWLAFENWDESKAKNSK